MKKLKDISWQVSEERYREDDAISYSTLARFERDGVLGLKKLILDNEKVESSSLLFGSIVDTLLTDSDNFDNLYIVSSCCFPSDDIKPIIDSLWKKTYALSLYSIPPSIMLEVIEKAGYGGANWKGETKINKVIAAGADYYSLLPLTKDGKRLITDIQFAQAKKVIEVLKTHPYTDWMWALDIEYQLKFKISFNDIENKRYIYNWQDEIVQEDTIRSMMDICAIDHKNKIIYPIDLKTTSSLEWEFDKSIDKWNYHIQAQMYSYILREVCKTDNYFKDFKIMPFRFLCINKQTLSPAFWVIEDSVEDIQKPFINTQNKIVRPWYEILNDVEFHINNSIYNTSKQIYENKGHAVYNKRNSTKYME